VPIPHPIHLHGHDFYVLGTGSGTFNISTSPSTLTYNNPTRRDVALLPGGGWLALAFQTDNPGAWLMHCHIAWHISEGLGVQFLESKSTINLPDATWETTCSNWDKYWENPVWPKTDSGL
jgi:FtsP/CotA-like multicopper oxidase with cupredoxin domain